MEGPNQILPADSYSTVDRNGVVKILVEDEAPFNTPPESIPGLLERVTALDPEHPALKVKRNGKWLEWSYKRYLAETRSAGKAFIKLGLEPRNSVAIMGFNSPEWYIADLGCVFVNGIATGIYPTNSPEACKYILNDCQANVAVVEDEKQLDKILRVRDECPALKAIVQYTGTPTEEGVLSWQQLLDLGNREEDAALKERLSHVAINQCCHLVYTSGTTGPPKGVMLSHDNLTYTAKVLCDTFHMRQHQERIVSYLPLSHVAANVTDVFVMMHCASTVFFADKDALKGTLTATLRDALPTLFLAVPRVWEKIYEKMMEVGRANKGLKRQIGTWAKKTGLKHNQKLLNWQNSAEQHTAAATGISKSLQYKIAEKVVFSKVKAQLGLNKCLRCYSAAAPLSKEMINYFMSLDIRILEIYGMSECSGPQLTNTNECMKVGTIGKTLKGFHTKLEPLDQEETSMGVVEGGEICMKGRNIMMGYLGNPTKTSETFNNDHYLRSGDLGTDDDDGFISITGRIKEILITAGGENVAPVLIEDAIKKQLDGVISNAVVIGDRRKFLSCLLTLKVDVDPDTLEPGYQLAPNALNWCRDLGSQAQTVQDCLADDLVLNAIQEGIDRANQESISNAQRVQKWVILAKDFSIPGGELGPTLKVKRHVVTRNHKDRINSLYV